MHRLARKDLEALVYVAIATAPPPIKRGLHSKHVQERDEARGKLTKAICDRIDNEAFMVIVTEMVATMTPYPRRGKWGRDEPVPAVVPEPPKPPDPPELGESH